MAFVLYQSKQVATGTTSTLVVTKPTSLAVGEVMLAGICSNGGAVTPPASWQTILDTDNTIRLTTFYKIATAGDVAATDFTFTFAGSPSFTQGWISRLTSANSTPVDQSNSGTGSGTSVSITGITPTKASGLFFFVAAYAQNSGAGNPSNSSAQAIATDNPTWTEDYDVSTATGGGSYIGMSMAYANRPVLTASGSATLTYSVSTSAYAAQLFNIAPLDNGPFSLAGSLGIASVPVSQIAPLSILGAVIDATFSAVAPLWNNIQKSASSWTNKDKS